MTEFHKFPSIESLANLNRSFHARNAYFVESGLPVPPLPKLRFTGTVKLHGTNSAVVIPLDENPYFQSRNRIITPDDDNCGFAAWAAEKDWSSVTRNTILYGEWVGKGIQNTVAVSKMPFRAFVVFSAVDIETGFELNVDELNLPDGAYRITDFKTYEISVDFAHETDVQAALEVCMKETLAIEEDCPVGRALGYPGIGEGIVWTARDYEGVVRFKTKGEKHSEKVYRPPVDQTTRDAAVNLAERAVTQRFDQAIDYLREMGHPPTNHSIPVFVRWIVADILREEAIAVEEIGEKLIKEAIPRVAIPMFKELIK